MNDKGFVMLKRHFCPAPILKSRWQDEKQHCVRVVLQFRVIKTLWRGEIYAGGFPANISTVCRNSDVTADLRSSVDTAQRRAFVAVWDLLLI